MACLIAAATAVILVWNVCGRREWLSVWKWRRMAHIVAIIEVHTVQVIAADLTTIRLCWLTGIPLCALLPIDRGIIARGVIR